MNIVIMITGISNTIHRFYGVKGYVITNDIVRITSEDGHHTINMKNVICLSIKNNL